MTDPAAHAVVSLHLAPVGLYTECDVLLCMNNRENEKELRNNQVSEWSYLTGRSGSPKNLCSSSRWQTVISGGNRISAVCTASCETIVARAKGSLWQSKT